MGNPFPQISSIPAPLDMGRRKWCGPHSTYNLLSLQALDSTLEILGASQSSPVLLGYV